MKTYLDLFLNEYESVNTRRSYNATINVMLDTIGKDVNDICKIDLVEYKNTLNTCASGCMLTMNVNHNFNLLAKSMLKIIYYKDEYKNLKQNLQSTLPLFINDARKFLIHNVGV